MPPETNCQQSCNLCSPFCVNSPLCAYCSVDAQLHINLLLYVHTTMFSVLCGFVVLSFTLRRPGKRAYIITQLAVECSNFEHCNTYDTLCACVVYTIMLFYAIILMYCIIQYVKQLGMTRTIILCLKSIQKTLFMIDFSYNFLHMMTKRNVTHIAQYNNCIPQLQYSTVCTVYVYFFNHNILLYHNMILS